MTPKVQTLLSTTCQQGNVVIVYYNYIVTVFYPMQIHMDEFRFVLIFIF